MSNRICILDAKPVSPGREGESERRQIVAPWGFCYCCCFSIFMTLNHVCICVGYSKNNTGVSVSQCVIRYWSVVYPVLQTDRVDDGRNPSIKKGLFPLFNSKNSLKHNSSQKVLPVVPSPMLQHQSTAPYSTSPVNYNPLS